MGRALDLKRAQETCRSADVAAVLWTETFNALERVAPDQESASIENYLFSFQERERDSMSEDDEKAIRQEASAMPRLLIAASLWTAVAATATAADQQSACLNAALTAYNDANVRLFASAVIPMKMQAIDAGCRSSIVLV